MKFNVDHHFTYIKASVDEHKKQLQSYYKLTEDELEEITKEWLVNVLVPADLTEMFDVDSPETMLDRPGPRKMKKDDEVQDVHSTSTKTSISPEQGGNGGEIGGTEVEKNKGKVTPPREEEDPSKNRKVIPPNPSSQKKVKATRTTFKTTSPQMTLTS
jgi:hypothetical protein